MLTKHSTDSLGLEASIRIGSRLLPWQPGCGLSFWTGLVCILTWRSYHHFNCLFVLCNHFARYQNHSNTYLVNPLGHRYPYSQKRLGTSHVHFKVFIWWMFRTQHIPNGLVVIVTNDVAKWARKTRNVTATPFSSIAIIINVVIVPCSRQLRDNALLFNKTDTLSLQELFLLVLRFRVCCCRVYILQAVIDRSKIPKTFECHTSWTYSTTRYDQKGLGNDLKLEVVVRSKLLQWPSWCLHHEFSYLQTATT